LIYYEFSKEKPISEINKEFLEKKNQTTGTRGSIQGVPRGMLTSA
jgi:hypothetical protein